MNSFRPSRPFHTRGSRRRGFAAAPAEPAPVVHPADRQVAHGLVLRKVEKAMTVRRKEAAEVKSHGHASQFSPHGGPQGHRARMHEKLVCRGPEALADYEVLEMLLFFAQEKGDPKPRARRLINRFGSFGGVMAASNEELLGFPQVGPMTLAAIRLVKAAALLMVRSEVSQRTVLADWEKLTGYLTAVMQHERREHFRVLFLDSRNRLIADEVLGLGTVNHVSVYPREVIKRGLEVHATAMILVHNHPTGNPKPSLEDIAMTNDLCRIGEALSIVVHDHIIVGRDGLFSFRDKKLL